MRAFAQLYDYSVNTVHTSIYDAGTVRWLATRIQSPRSTLGVTCVVLLHNFITHNGFNCNGLRARPAAVDMAHNCNAGRVEVTHL